MTAVLIVLAAMVMLGIYAWYIEPRFLQVKRQEVGVASDRLQNELRILFISDLHVGRYNSTSLLKAKCRRLERLHRRHPFDLILLGGDLIDREARFLPDLTKSLNILAGWQLPFFAVLGNHDYFAFSELSPLKAALAEVRCQLLCGEAVEVSCAGQTVLLIGLNDLETDQGYRESQAEYPAWEEYSRRAASLSLYSQFDQVSPGLPRVILAHNPDAAYLPGKQPADLVLSGHTHGGQTLFHRLFGRYISHFMPQSSFIAWSGRKEVQGTTLIVSRGIQGSWLPLRFLIPPDVQEITLRPVEVASS
ncbi:MAG: metallophosphoesterase [bacterium]